MCIGIHVHVHVHVHVNLKVYLCSCMHVSMCLSRWRVMGNLHCFGYVVFTNFNVQHVHVHVLWYHKCMYMCRSKLVS